MRLPIRVYRGILPALMTIIPAVTAPAHAGGYPPATGPVARRQAVRDLGSSAVVLVVAAEPGEEDLGLIAALRMGEGARVVAAFVTDGGATPSDIDGALPMHVAARRRYEADAALRAVGGEPYFMGFPDYGFVAEKSSLETLWSRDSLVARLVAVIRAVRPDVILLAHDAREEEGDAIRQGLIREMVLAAGKSAAGQGARGIPGPAWAVARVCEEAAGGAGPATLSADRVDPMLKKSYRAVGTEAARAYASLRLSVPGRMAERPGAYRVLRGEGSGGGIIGGLPVVPAGLRAAGEAVRRAAKAAAGGPDATALRSIEEAIAVVEHAVADGKGRLTSIERRLLVGWKDGLESLRCTVLGVDVRLVLSDTLVARRQQFAIRFPRDRRFPAGGVSEIIFPGAMDSTWLINGSEGFRFAFALPDTFTILTPGEMPWNRPVSSNGSRSTTLNASFPLLIAHKDPDPLRRFVLRRDVGLGVSPNQSLEFLTPFVRVTPGERLVVRLQNVSRDIYRGTMSVGDSVVRPEAVRIALKRSEGPVDDSLALSWRESVSSGDHVIALRIGKGPPVGTFIARKFDATVNAPGPVGLFTGLRHSPVAAALRRLGVGCALLDASFGDSALARFRTVIVDRDALLLRPDGPRASAAIEAWVRRGGRCVLLAQRWNGKSGDPLAKLVQFGPPRLLPPEEPVSLDSSAGPAGAPNALAGGDWEGWIISRAATTVDTTGNGGGVAWCRDRASGAVLGASIAAGEGTVIAVALDLSPQLQIVHPGAYRLLANLVSH